MFKRRRRIKHTLTFEERLLDEARRCREQARQLPAGVARDGLLRRARQAETAAAVNRWLTSPGLRQPE